MSDAHRDPHVLVSAKIGGSQKLLDLPSHRARWGWIVMLGQAKLQRPPGRFASLAQARFLAGEFRDCVPAWLEVGLLHAAPVARECKSSGCGPAALGEITDAEMIVHDWRAHQERSRTAEWRDLNGVPNGHSNLSGETSGKQPGNTGETPSPRVPTRDPAGAVQSLSLSTSETTEGVQGEPSGYPTAEDRDCLDTYHELTRFRPWGIWSGDKLRGAAREYGDEAVTQALRASADEDPDVDSLMDRTFARLAKDAERAKRSKPKPRLVKPAIDRAAFDAERRRLMEPGATA